VAGQTKRLERDTSNKVIAGVASGVANYFEIDPTIVRVLWALTILFGGLGFVVYIVMWIVVPEADPTNPDSGGSPSAASAETTSTRTADEPEDPEATDAPGST
jgi:phage shock protein PspC (stress-responsive transcriptional regulator)